MSNLLKATIGMDFHSKNVKIDNQDVRFLLYDTAGQEKFRSLIPMYIRDANIILFVYDISSKWKIISGAETFKSLETHWLEQIQQSQVSNAIFALVGNKLDLDGPKREINKSDAEAFAKEHNFIFHEVSAMTGVNINSLFYKDIFDQIIVKFRMGGEEPPESKFWFYS